MIGVILETKRQEEESRHIALKALEERYCMNCFQVKSECSCSEVELRLTQTEDSKPVKSVCEERVNER